MLNLNYTKIFQVSLHISNLMYLRANNKKMNLLNIVQDGCNILGGVHNSRLMKVIREQIVQVTNFPKKCPILAVSVLQITSIYCFFIFF